MEWLPTPQFYQPQKVAEIWKIPYQERAEEARDWAQTYNITHAITDKYKIGLLLVDVQNTFCLPDYELFVRGRSGTGAVDDNQRLCEFIYHNLHRITDIIVTMDTHQAMQIFHAIFLVDQAGNHPSAYTLISYDDIENGKWLVNPALLNNLKMNEEQAREHLLHYTKTLKNRGKYNLTIWPYHAMLGSIGHALVPSLEEAIFFHTAARYSQPDIIVKGDHPLTEHYSVIGPEILTRANGRKIARKSSSLLLKLQKLDALFIAGQAKSHCVSWTIQDLYYQIKKRDPKLVRKIYLLDDCTSSVVIPNVVDYTEQAEEAYQHFASAGMHIVKSNKWHFEDIEDG